jgi:hypothetical protein
MYFEPRAAAAFLITQGYFMISAAPLLIYDRRAFGIRVAPSLIIFTRATPLVDHESLI